MASNILKNEKVGKLLKYGEKVELLHDWVFSNDDIGESSLKWKTIPDQQQHQHFKNSYDKCNGKLPVEIFEVLFNHQIRSHLITKTITYASVVHNDSAFSTSRDDLCKFVGVLFLSGYHTLPQQQLY